MKKKYWLLSNILKMIAVMAIIILAESGFCDFHNQSIILQLEEENWKQNLIIQEDMTAHLLFQAYDIPFDSEKNCYYLPWNEETSPRHAEFRVAEEGISLHWLEDDMLEDMHKAIVEGHEFQLYLKKNGYYCARNIVFTGAAAMSVDYAEMENEDINCRITVFDPFSQNGYNISQSYGFFELRGRTSLKFPKQSYKFSLLTQQGEKNACSLLGLRRDDEWKLNALYTDGSKVREKIAMEMWNTIAKTTETKADSGTNMEYMELIYNGSFLGLYGLMEPIDFGQTNLDKSQNVMYKTLDYPSDAYSVNDDLTGIKEWNGFKIKAGSQPITNELWKPAKDYLEHLGDYDFINTHMDMDNLLDFELYIQAIRGEDNNWKNQIFTVEGDYLSDYTMRKIPWDLNYSFGDSYEESEEDLTVYRSENACKLMHHYLVTNEFLEDNDEAVRPLIEAKWKELRTLCLNEEYVKETGEAFLMKLNNSGALERDRVKWPMGDHEVDLDDIEEFFSERLEYLDDYYLDLE